MDEYLDTLAPTNFASNDELCTRLAEALHEDLSEVESTCGCECDAPSDFDDAEDLADRVADRWLDTLGKETKGLLLNGLVTKVLAAAAERDGESDIDNVHGLFDEMLALLRKAGQ